MKPIPNKTRRSGAPSRRDKARVLLVDDHPVVRQGMAELINKQPDLVVCGEADNTSGALSAVTRFKPDVVLADITLKNSDGMELIRSLRLQQPQLPILVVSMHDESLNAEQVLRAGAKGYIMKDQAIVNVLVAIRRVLGGKIYLSDEMTSRMLQTNLGGAKGESPLESLSQRELQVFRLVGQWCPTRKIAEQLHLSIKTVEYYREKIKEKLNLRSGTELTHYATRWIERNQS
jgi:DNA-binding NarL/FixJ family response regulator